MGTQEIINRAMFEIADMELRKGLEKACRDSEREVNELLKPLGKLCHIRLTVEYNDLPVSEQPAVEPTQSAICVEGYKETKS